MSFAENAKKIMKKKGIKQNDLARKIGMSSSGISTALGENSNPRLDTVLAISDALNARVSELVGEDSGWHSLSPEMKKLFSAEHPVPDILDFGASTTNPAMLGGMNDAVMRLFDVAGDLSPEEADQARAFVLGLKANRKPGPVPPPSDQK